MRIAHCPWILDCRQPDPSEDITSPYAVWVKDSLEVAFDQVRRHSGQAVQRQKRLYDQWAVRHLFAIGDWAMRYYPAGTKYKLDSIWTGPYLIVATLGWTVGIQKHPDEPVIFIHCQDVKKIPNPVGRSRVLQFPRWGGGGGGGAPAVAMLGASTVAHTSRDSPSVMALPPDEGVVLADVDSMCDGHSISHHSGSGHASMPSDDCRRTPLTDSVSPAVSPFAVAALQIDDTSAMPPFSVHKSDAGPVRLLTIAHAFNYRMAVLRDGVKSAVRVGRSRKAEGCFLSGSDIPWGQQVAELEKLKGVSPNVHLQCEPWGHINHEDIDCDCQTSDRTVAYVHDLTVKGWGLLHSPDAGVASTCYTRSNGHLCIEPSWERGRPGLVPFVSDMPGAYGRLLLTVYVRWQTGLLVSSDWLRPVTRGGWRAGFPDRGRISADVS